MRELYVSHRDRSAKEILGLRWSKKAKITLETISFRRNVSVTIFKFSPIFIYNESLPMKSYQLFQIYKRFDKETEKTLLQQSMRKEELIKVRLCFIIGCFIRSFKMIILSFYFTCSFAVYFLLFDISMTQKIEKREIRNGELLGMTNYKNNFNILGKNLTQKKFLY